MTKLNKALMASTAIAFASGLAMPASAQDPSAAPGVVSSQKKVKIRLYGQIARQFGVVGDGEEVTFKQGSNGNTSTRMGIDGRGKITKDINLRTRLEYQVQSGSTGGGNQFENEGEPGTASRFTVRHLDVIISSKKFGAVWIGRGDTASNGTSEINLAKIDTARLGGSTANTVSEFIFLNENETPSGGTNTVGRYYNSFDGTGRQNRIRYDTPTLFGFKAGASIIDKHNFEAALRYKGKILGTDLQAGVGYCHTNGRNFAGQGACFNAASNGVDQLNGSISFKLPIGLGATFSGGTQWLDAPSGTTLDDPYNLQPSIFYTTKLTELGTTTFEYAYQYCKNCGGNDTEGQGHSVVAMQRIDSVGGDYYVTFRYMDAERPSTAGPELDQLWYVGGGFRQRF